MLGQLAILAGSFIAIVLLALLCRVLGLGRVATIESLAAAGAAVRRHQLSFTPAMGDGQTAGVLARDGKAALVFGADGRLGLVVALGDRLVARVLPRPPAVETATDGLTLRLDDITLPRVHLALTPAEATALAGRLGALS